MITREIAARRGRGRRPAGLPRPAAWALAASLAAAPCAAQPPPAPSDPAAYPRAVLGGLVFGDLYYNVAGDPDHAYNAAGADTANPVNIDGSRVIGRDLNGAQIRRLYFQLDHDLSARFSSRFRLEMDGRSLTSDGKLGVSVKGAFLHAKQAYPRGDVLFGLLSTPVWEVAEEFWGYRPVERTIADFRGLGPASDLGVQVRGHLDRGRRLGYVAMVGNGPGQKPEDNRYKKVYLSLPVRAGGLSVEPYADYEHAAGSKDRATYKLFAGCEARRFALGAEALSRVNHSPAGGNQEPRGLSLYGRATLGRALAGFARFDLWQPDRRARDRVDSQLWIGGLDWQVAKDVHVMPNVEATQYRARGAAVAPPHHDVQARVTVFYRFRQPPSP